MPYCFVVIHSDLNAPVLGDMLLTWKDDRDRSWKPLQGLSCRFVVTRSDLSVPVLGDMVCGIRRVTVLGLGNPFRL